MWFIHQRQRKTLLNVKIWQWLPEIKHMECTGKLLKLHAKWVINVKQGQNSWKNSTINNKHVHCPTFAPLVFSPQRLKSWGKHKYAKKYDGPFKVIDRINSHNYIVNVFKERKVVWKYSNIANISIQKCYLMIRRNLFKVTRY